MSNQEDAAVLWGKTAESFQRQLTEPEDIGKAERYFPMFRSFNFVNNELRIGVEDDFRMETFNEIYSERLTKVLRDISGNESANVKFELINKSAPENNSEPEKPEPPPEEKKIPQKAPFKPQNRPGGTASMHMDTNYTFENFVKGPSNSFAYAEAVAVAKAPGRTAYNPLFIWGQTGLGKTHIMQAIGNRVLSKIPGITVCYVTAENYLNHYINALSSEKLPQFRQRFRKVDVLMIDDVQFIAGKVQIQEEFFNNFTELMNLHKQVVMTSDVPPRNLKDFADRLISRFEGGMVTEIESPSFETRLAILKLKASAYNRLVPQEILSFIAENIKSHVRGLEGALRRVMAFHELNQDMPLTIDIVRHLLKDQINDEEAIKNLSLEDILKVTADYYGVSVKDIIASGRSQSVVTPRQVAMFVSRKLVIKSLPDIAKVFDRTHATVHHGISQIRDRLLTEAKLRSDISEIAIRLGRSPEDIFNNNED